MKTFHIKHPDETIKQAIIEKKKCKDFFIDRKDHACFVYKKLDLKSYLIIENNN